MPTHSLFLKSICRKMWGKKCGAKNFRPSAQRAAFPYRATTLDQREPDQKPDPFDLSSRSGTTTTSCLRFSLYDLGVVERLTVLHAAPERPHQFAHHANQSLHLTVR
jgi:hypothetical protein